MIVHELVKRGKGKVLQSLVSTYGFDVNAQREDGCTPLHLASWYNQESLKLQLMQLGADPSLRNSYGEVASQVEGNTISSMLQGARSFGDVLELVHSRLADFSAREKVQAFHLLGVKTSKTESFESRPVQMQAEMRSQPAYMQLVHACSELINGPMDEMSPVVWTSLLKSMVLLRENHILESMAARFEQQDMAKIDWEADRIALVLWGLAKIDAGKPRWIRGFVVFGNILAAKLSNLDQRFVSMSVWAYGKMRLKHEGFFEACSEYLETRGQQLEPQTLSGLTWAFARSGFHNLRALTTLARLCIQRMDEFINQDVANSAWALAKLERADAAFFQAAFMEASKFLFTASYKRHVRVAGQADILSWAQIYYAYRFCVRRCEEGLRGMSPHLSHDLRSMDRMRMGENVEGAFSESSGLNSDRRLRDLDRLIESLERGEGIDEGLDLPGDSLEAQHATAASDDMLQASEANARLSQEMIGAQRTHMPRVLILGFSRSPESFKHALLEGPDLAPLRASLQERQYPCVLDSGAKVFVRPEQYEAVLEAIRQEEARGLVMKSSHVIVSEDVEEMVVKVLCSVPSSQQVRVRTAQELP
ncbi:unnamed protein product, partial [Symbiodinium pilosum]